MSKKVKGCVCGKLGGHLCPFSNEVLGLDRRRGDTGYSFLANYKN